MYHPPSKRRQLIQRTAIYSFMTVSVIVLVAILTLLMLGYRLDRSGGKIEQGGLVQFGTKPAGANVTIDGTQFGTRTPSKTTLTAGSHFITMNRAGYRPWQKSVSITAGGVLWLNYGRLIPTDVTPASVANFSSVFGSLASPDKKKMAIIERATTPTIHLADLTKDVVSISDIVVPRDSYASPGSKKHSFSIEAWSPNSRYLLVRHGYEGKTEWLVVDSQDVTKTKNVTELLNIELSDVVFAEENDHILYAISKGDVRRIDLSQATISRPLARNVAEFSVYNGSDLVFVTKSDGKTKQRTIGYYSDGAQKTRTLKTYNGDAAASLHVAVRKYFGDMYVAIAHEGTIDVFSGELPRSDSDATSSLGAVTTITIPGEAHALSMRTNGRFVVAEHGGGFTVYDIELKKTTTTAFKASQGGNTDKLRWLDDYTIADTKSGMLRLYEFDGANQQEIMATIPGMDVTLSPNDKYLYGLTTTQDGRYYLSRVLLTLP